MAAPNEMAPEAAATAPRAGNVASGKSTVFDCPNANAISSAISALDNGKRRRSLRSAVNAMCKSCIYDPGSGNGAWRQQVQACSSSNCPLHSVRPVPVKARKTVYIVSPTGIGSVTTAGPGQALTAPEIGLNDDTVDERRAA